MYITAPKQEGTYIYCPQAGGDVHILSPSRRGRTYITPKQEGTYKEGGITNVYCLQAGGGFVVFRFERVSVCQRWDGLRRALGG
jgi:hypothetical protein